MRQRGVPETQIPDSLRWAQDLAVSKRGRLRDRSAAEVCAFLESATAEALVNLAREALAILYQDLLHLNLRRREAGILRSGRRRARFLPMRYRIVR